MSRTQRLVVIGVGVITVVGSAAVAVVYGSQGVEVVSYVAGIGSFLLAVVTLVVATSLGRRYESISPVRGDVTTAPVGVHARLPQAPTPSRAPDSAVPATSNLPRRNRAFTGRTHLLTDLHEELTHGRVAVVAVRGMGGIGKTQLALEYAHQQRRAGLYELTWWVHAETALTLTADLARLSPVLGVEADADQERTIAAVLAGLRQRDRWLVVFDNAPDAAAVRDLLPPDNGHTLITSRDQAWGGIAHPVDLGTFTRAEAVSYLQQRTGRNEPQAAAQLAEVVGDLPLALAQAAAYLEQQGGLSIQAFLKRYRDQEDAAQQIVAELDDYPHSVATTWLIHFDDMTAHHRAALQLLRLCAFLDPDDIDLALLLSTPGILTGALTGQLADAVANPAEREAVIDTLARTALISRIDGAHRVRIHRLVAEITRTQLPKRQPSRWRWPWRLPAADRAAWADHVVTIINARFPDDPHQPSSWATCTALAAHADSAVSYGSAQPIAGALMLRLGKYLHTRADLAAAETAVQSALDIFTRLFGPDHADVALVLTELGALHRRRDQLEQAQTNLQSALDIFTRLFGPDHADVARVLTERGALHRRRGQLDLAQ
ncbi:MAG TPA: FxSxx-COOH system tetratricopeptide repeat protein [Candidatus Limnocylindrales bacterium]|nr:FxSxx-COOH system tetratricopeptide repeat protein [Candidatus Limnocylindrales bacterium]